MIYRKKRGSPNHPLVFRMMNNTIKKDDLSFKKLKEITKTHRKNLEQANALMELLTKNIEDINGQTTSVLQHLISSLSRHDEATDEKKTVSDPESFKKTDDIDVTKIHQDIAEFDEMDASMRQFEEALLLFDATSYECLMADADERVRQYEEALMLLDAAGASYDDKIRWMMSM